MPSSALLPTPEPAKIPSRWPRPQVRSALIARMPRSSGSRIGRRSSGVRRWPSSGWTPSRSMGPPPATGAGDVEVSGGRPGANLGSAGVGTARPALDGLELRADADVDLTDAALDDAAPVRQARVLDEVELLDAVERRSQLRQRIAQE